MPEQTIDLCDIKGQGSGWQKVTTKSVTDVLNWHPGNYNVVVKDAEPLNVPLVDIAGGVFFSGWLTTVR